MLSLVRVTGRWPLHQGVVPVGLTQQVGLTPGVVDYQIRPVETRRRWTGLARVTRLIVTSLVMCPDYH